MSVSTASRPAAKTCPPSCDGRLGTLFYVEASIPPELLEASHPVGNRPVPQMHNPGQLHFNRQATLSELRSLR